MRGWARDWNAKGVAGWPHAWVLAAPTRPITAAALIAETLTYGAALKVMIQVRGDMWRVYAPSKATLLETLAKLPGEALAQIPLDGGYRYQCFGSRSAAFVPRAAGLFEIARSAPDPAIALFGQLIDAP